MTPRVWFVTAASSGFGKGIAIEALKRGDKVVATARRSYRLADLKAQGALVLDLDVTQPLDELKAIVAEAHRHYGRIDVLANVAGYGLVGGLEEASPKETFDSFNTNVFGVLNVTRAVLPYMRSQKSGVIALCGSVGSWFGAPAAGVYVSTKWAISGLCECLREEVAPFGIDVCCIEPGYFRTSFLDPGVVISTEQRLQDYDESAVGQTRAFYQAQDTKQPGDVEKGCKVIVEVLTKEEGKEIPVRLVLGSDAYRIIMAKCNNTKALLEDWKDVICSTDYPEGK